MSKPVAFTDSELDELAIALWKQQRGEPLTAWETALCRAYDDVQERHLREMERLFLEGTSSMRDPKGILSA